MATISLFSLLADIRTFARHLESWVLAATAELPDYLKMGKIQGLFCYQFVFELLILRNMFESFLRPNSHFAQSLLTCSRNPQTLFLSLYLWVCSYVLETIEECKYVQPSRISHVADQHMHVFVQTV